MLLAADLIRSTKRIVIVGIGASFNASIPLESLLCSHGIDAIAVEAGELLHYRHDAYRDSVFIVVSRSGESVEIVRLLTALRGRVPIIGVTDEPGSALALKSNLVLDVCSLPDEMVAIQSYSGTLLTLFLLGMAVLDRLDAARQEVEALLPNLARLIETTLHELPKWDTFLERDAPVYSLGRGPSYGSALQGALLFSEIAKVPAVAMAVASFRHGPIEVVDQRFRGLIFAPQGRTRDLNVALAMDLVRFGGTVRVIGPGDPDQSGLQWINTPAVSDMLAPLLEIVPVQAAAMRLAQLRDIAVGKLRFTPRVSRDEGFIAG